MTLIHLIIGLLVNGPVTTEDIIKSLTEQGERYAASSVYKALIIMKKYGYITTGKKGRFLVHESTGKLPDETKSKGHESNYHYWTPSAIQCYELKSNCQRCSIHNSDLFIGDIGDPERVKLIPCQMKTAINALEQRLGPPKKTGIGIIQQDQFDRVSTLRRQGE